MIIQAVIASLVAMVAAEADPAGILWTHPNGVGFRSGVYGLGLNAHIPTGGYPHSHGLLVKREAEAEPHGYYGYGYAPRYPLNGLGKDLYRNGRYTSFYEITT